MKKTLLAIILATCTTSAFAAETAVLKVKGVLTNAACSPELTKGGIVDYGTIHLSDLSDSAVNQLGQQTIDLTINCGAATKVGWHLEDNRVDSRAGITVNNGDDAGGAVSDTDKTYGVGLTADGVAIGNYSLFVKTANVVADGESADTIVMDGNNNAWSKSVDGLTAGQNNRDITVATAGSTEPLPFISATFPLVTSLAIQDTKTLAITDDTDLNGQVTISLRYL